MGHSLSSVSDLNLFHGTESKPELPHIRDFCGERVKLDLAHISAKPTTVSSPNLSAMYKGYFWDTPVSGVKSIVYSDSITGQPIFSSKDQIIKTNECVGMLQFTKPLDPAGVVRNDNGEILVPQKQWVASNPGSDTCALLGSSHDADGLTVGSVNGGIDEFLGSSTGHSLNSVFGPHYLGFQSHDGTLCVDPAAIKASNAHVLVDRQSNGPVVRYDPLPRMKG